MVTAAVMQPYFFPYAGYFSLLKSTDRFILLDDVQFIRHGWIARNRILKRGGGWLYIIVPLLGHSRRTSIREIRIDNRQPWREKIAAQLQAAYEGIAPFYSEVSRLVNDALAEEFRDIVSQDRAALEGVLGYLGMTTELCVLSELQLVIDPPKEPDDWGLNVCRALGDVSEYHNSPGGEAFHHRSKYAASGIPLKFVKPVLQEYDQRRSPFEPDLSIIDVLMFNEPEVVNAMLDGYELV